MNIFSNLKIRIEKLRRAPVGTYVYIRKNEQFPEGTLGKIISYNTFQSEYQITTKVQSELSPSNVYILENEETGFKVLEEEFNNGEFVKYSDVEVIDFEPKKRFLGYIVKTLLIVGMGLLVATEVL